MIDLHFEESHVITEDITKLPDGSEYRLKRNRPTLQQNAVPKYFLGFPLPINIFGQEMNDNDFLLEIYFEKICRNVNSIRLPSVYWFSQATVNGIKINKWSDNRDVINTQVLVEADKTVQVNMFIIKII